VCLDEAQMVEGSTTKSTEMALLLDAQNRWCVTGTPIQRGLDDLFGLLRFLKAKPFDECQVWNQVLRHPYEV
jgi:E3 ubiquitin-protein ligase SHPRH